MAESLAKTTQDSRQLYNTSMGDTQTVSLGYAPRVADTSSSFSNDIDKLMGSTEKAAKTYYMLSDDASKIVATDHLVRYKEESIKITQDNSLSPEDKKAKLGELNGILNSEVADKIGDNDRAREIYDSVYSNNVRPLYADQMTDIDNTIYKRDMTILKDEVVRQSQAGVPLNVIFDNPATQTLINKNFMTKFDITTEYLKGVKNQVENDYNQATLNGENFVQNKFMQKDSRGISRYNPEALKQFVVNKLNGSVGIDEQGNIVPKGDYGTPEELTVYKNEINSFMAQYANEANKIEQFEEKEKDRSDSEAGKFNKMMAAFQAKQTANAAIANMNVNPDDVANIQTEINTLISAGDFKEAEKLNKDLSTAKANIRAKKYVDNYITNSLTKSNDPISIDSLKEVVTKGMSVKENGYVVDISADNMRDYIGSRLDGQMDLVSKQLNMNDPNSIANFENTAERVRGLSADLGVKINTFSKSTDFIEKNILGTIDSPDTLFKMTYLAKADAKNTNGDTNKIDRILGALDTAYRQGKTKGLSDTELVSYMIKQKSMVDKEYQAKKNKDIQEVTKSVLTNSWLSVDRSMHSTTEMYAVELLSKQNLPYNEKTVNKLIDSGDLIPTKTMVGSIANSTSPFDDNSNMVLAPSYRDNKGQYIKVPAETFRTNLDKYFKKNNLDIDDFDIGNNKSDNGTIGISIINKDDPRDVIFLNGDDIVNIGTKESTKPNYGKREDGTNKGKGWLGEIPIGNGSVMTEKSIGVEINGKEVLIPSLVPTLTKDEIESLKKDGMPSKEIIRKARDHAKNRIDKGLSPFKD